MELSAQKARYEDLRSLAFGSITTSFVAVGIPFENPVRILKVNNLTDADLLISFNGISTKDIVAANSSYIIDYSSDKSNQAGVLEHQANDSFYVKYTGSAPTVKAVYVTLIYASTT